MRRRGFSHLEWRYPYGCADDEYEERCLTEEDEDVYRAAL